MNLVLCVTKGTGYGPCIYFVEKQNLLLVSSYTSKNTNKTSNCVGAVRFLENQSVI